MTTRWTAAKLIETCREWQDKPCEYGCPIEAECKASSGTGVCLVVSQIADKLGIKGRKAKG